MQSNPPFVILAMEIPGGEGANASKEVLGEENVVSKEVLGEENVVSK